MTNYNEFLLKNIKSALDECKKFNNKQAMQPLIKALQNAYDCIFTLDHLGLMYDLSMGHWVRILAKSKGECVLTAGLILVINHDKDSLKQNE